MKSERELKEFVTFIRKNPIQTIDLNDIENFECNLGDGRYVDSKYIMSELSDISDCMDFYFNYDCIKCFIDEISEGFSNYEEVSEEEGLFFYAEYKGDIYLVKAYVKSEFKYSFRKNRFGEYYKPEKFKAKEIIPMRVIPLD